MKYEDALEYLDDYVDGTLADELHAGLEAALDDSPQLREELERVRELRRATAALPRAIEPPRDLWPGIASRIEANKLVRGRFTYQAPSGAAAVPAWQRWGLLAAAAMVLIVMSSGITAYLVRNPASQPAAPVARGETAGSAEFATVAWEEFRAAEVEYDKVTNELLDAMEERRDQLDPETVRIVEENLRLIDQAIDEARAALEKDPSNGQLAFKLNDIYRKRVDFLLQMNRL